MDNRAHSLANCFVCFSSHRFTILCLLPLVIVPHYYYYYYYITSLFCDFKILSHLDVKIFSYLAWFLSCRTQSFRYKPDFIKRKNHICSFVVRPNFWLLLFPEGQAVKLTWCLKHKRVIYPQRKQGSSPNQRFLWIFFFTWFF